MKAITEEVVIDLDELELSMDFSGKSDEEVEYQLAQAEETILDYQLVAQECRSELDRRRKARG